MDDRARSRASRNRRADAPRREARHASRPDATTRGPGRRTARRATAPSVLVAIVVIALLAAVPAGISWARGRRGAPPANGSASSGRPTSDPDAGATRAASTSASLAGAAGEGSSPEDASEPAEDTSWQEQYRGKLVLGFEPEPGYKAVALTFDDGPNGQTQYVLDTLAEYEGRGTFFDSGRKLKPTWARTQGRMIEKAGSEIANHTQSHTIDDVGSLWRRSYEVAVEEITRPDTYVMEQVGHKTLWVRPMGGMIDATGVKAAKDTGHLVINWTIDSNDSHGGPRTPEYIYEQCTENVKSGDVILLHVTKQESMDALPRICKKLRAEGFELVTVSELAKHSTPITAKIPK